MLELIGLIAIIYMVIKFGGDILKIAVQVFLGLALFFIALPFLIAIMAWMYNIVFRTGLML